MFWEKNIQSEKLSRLGGEGHFKWILQKSYLFLLFLLSFYRIILRQEAESVLSARTRARARDQ